MSEQVTLLDLSFNTGDATDGLDALIKKSLELAEKKTQLTKQINAEKTALAELRKSYNRNAADQTAYNKAVEKSTSTIVGLTKELNDNKSEITNNSAAIKAHTTIMQSGADSVKGMRAQLALNTKALDEMEASTRETTKEGKELVTQTKELSDKLKDMEKAIGDNRRNVGNYAGDLEKTVSQTGGLSGATGGLVKTMTGGITGVKAFNAVLKANPIVFILSVVIAIIAAIEKFINRNSELAASMKASFAPFQVIFGRLADHITNLFTGVVKAIEIVSKKVVELLEKLRLISPETKAAAEAARELAQAERDLYNKETDMILPFSEMKRELEETKAIISDQTKSFAERNAAAKKSLSIMEKMKQMEIEILEAKKLQIEANGNLTYTADEQRRKIIEAQAAINETNAKYSSMSKEIISQQSGLEKTIIAQGVAAVKAAEEQKRKDKEEEVRKAAETEKRVQQEILKSYEDSITELQLRIRESNIGIVDKRKALEDQDRLNQAILEKERYRLQQRLITQKEFDNIKLEQQIAFREKVAELEKEEAEKKKEQKALSVEQERIIEQANITSNFEKLAMNLETARKLEIEAAEKSGADVTAIEEKYAKLREELRKKEVNAKLQMTAEVAGQISNLLGQESAAGKAFALAQATINTYLGASKAIAQGGIWGVAQAAIVIAAGLKQVASIMKVKEEVPKTNTSVKKFAKGGTVFGAPHSQGGVTFTGSNGQQFEAEGGENMYILNKRASHAINALSALNQQYGGRSFGNSSLYKFADGGQLSITRNVEKNTGRVAKQSSEVKLSRESLAELALIVVEGFANAPNPIVSVQDITDVQQNRAIVIDSAGY